MRTAAAIKNIFVVEDSPAVRARLVEWLGAIDGAHIVGEAGTPDEAVRGILRTQPHFVVLDFQLEGGTGADVLRAIRAQAPRAVFIVVTNHMQPQFRRVCMEAGANAFFDKSTELGKVREMIAGAAPA